ncbi:hypothetical protein Sango_1254200 [Sesamum angolense]|uniref:Integrase catalytic domain-containing protein n=1 Tax=Sesamum angolense TaxID=2727404 RepID=A0AAE2BU20_9LAMI|nr:hypothetical protein Sango_1254200 [Sesamum angolense]
MSRVSSLKLSNFWHYHEEDTPYFPSSNGVAERKNRTFKDMINSLLLTSGLPKYLWGETLNTTCHILNRVPLKHNTTTPFELWKGIPSSVSLDDSLASTSIPEHVENMTNVGVNPNSTSLTHEESDEPRRSKRARVVKDFGSDFVTYNIKDDPVTFKDAINSPEAKQWKEVVKSEMDSIVSNRTLVLVGLPPGCTTIEFSWKSVKQTLITRSTFEAELSALDTTALTDLQARWFAKFGEDGNHVPQQSGLLPDSSRTPTPFRPTNPPLLPPLCFARLPTTDQMASILSIKAAPLPLSTYVGVDVEILPPPRVSSPMHIGIPSNLFVTISGCMNVSPSPTASFDLVPIACPSSTKGNSVERMNMHGDIDLNASSSANISWDPSAPIVPTGIFIVAMEEVLKGGPWLFQGQPIVLQQWQPGMALRKTKHTDVPVWIKLRHFPVELWIDEGLSTVASGIGKTALPGCHYEYMHETKLSS